MAAWVGFLVDGQSYHLLKLPSACPDRSARTLERALQC